MDIALAGPQGSPTRLLIYSETGPSAVDAGSGDVDWKQTGRNLYTITLPGGEGVSVHVDF